MEVCLWRCVRGGVFVEVCLWGCVCGGGWCGGEDVEVCWWRVWEKSVGVVSLCILTSRHLATLHPRVPAPRRRHLVSAMAGRSRDGRMRQRISFRFRSTEDSASLGGREGGREGQEAEASSVLILKRIHVNSNKVGFVTSCSP